MSRIVSVLLMVLVLVFGMFIGSRLNRENVGELSGSQSKMIDAYRLISSSYVDPVNADSLASAGIQGMVQSLDPHTMYLEPEKAAYSNAEFKGNFDGIGIEFDVVRDTLLVVTPLAGGPSDAVGIMPGDRIIAIDSKRAIGITPTAVLKRLRGERGAKVNLTIYRPLTSRTLDFTVTRGKISTSSIDAAFLDDAETGYIRISQFVATTSKEFRAALEKLRAQGMKRLIIDVRGNPGGFLDQAVAVADELLPDGELIVYTKSPHGGEDQMRYASKSGGLFETGQLALLVDRGSASAAEILAGALQDNRRAIVIGELTFGKGLVQRQFAFSDGSALRLTVSRYYTPSGRQIQRSYDEGAEGRENYYKERFTRELQDSFMKKYGGFIYRDGGDISVYSTSRMMGSAPGDSLKAVLAQVGGIMPDYLVFSKSYSNLFQELYARGVIEDLALKLIDDPKSQVQQYRESAEKYLKEYHGPSDLKALIRKECAARKIPFSIAEYNRDRNEIALAIKARIARQLFGTEEQIRVLIREGDPFMKVTRHLIEQQAS
ncbi:MAG TPA: S41 family peptidase [Chlorobaculum parvum]|uniref:S41 family peptidase n=1 Tax=Chlorobaculum parvum TaxID=274539 RepID=A0A7C5HB05_9CHLB|nr:S41 family peptidase [Chlorobaculum parvum]